MKSLCYLTRYAALLAFATASSSQAFNCMCEGKALELTSEEVLALMNRPSPNSAEPGEAPYIQIDDMRFPVAVSTDGPNATSAFTYSFSGSRWPNGIVYYQFASNISDTNKQRFRNATKEWSNAADLTFIESTGSGSYILVVSEGGNWSYVGMQPSDRQPQKLSMYNWSQKYIIAHEIGHALGLAHEQSRSDRDNYVNVIWSNIPEDKQPNFYRDTESINFGPYDFDSVMHYPRYGFAINPNINTLEPKPAYRDYLYTMGQRGKLSELDKQGMAGHYGPPNKLTAFPSSIDFDVCLVGSTKSLRIVIENSGDETVTGTASIDAPFSVIEGAHYNLSNGATQDVVVSFQPTVEGSISTTLSFSSGESLNVNAIGITNQDTDGDGASDYAEYIAGTSQTNPNDFFSIEPISHDPESAISTFEIDTKNGRSYQLQGTYHLVYVPWYNIGEEVIGDGSTHTITAPIEHPQSSYRVVVNKND